MPASLNPPGTPCIMEMKPFVATVYTHTNSLWASELGGLPRTLFARPLGFILERMWPPRLNSVLKVGAPFLHLFTKFIFAQRILNLVGLSQAG